MFSKNFLIEEKILDLLNVSLNLFANSFHKIFDVCLEASQPSSQEESTLANEFQTACSLEELKSSEQLITATPAENEQFDRTYVLQVLNSIKLFQSLNWL